jgi:hypothetical protein
LVAVVDPRPESGQRHQGQLQHGVVEGSKKVMGLEEVDVGVTPALGVDSGQVIW